MDDHRTFEDFARAVGRHRLLVAVIVAVLTLLGAAYGYLTTARGAYTADVSVHVVPTNELTVGQATTPASGLNIITEAARADADLETLAGTHKDDVTVAADAIGLQIVFTAQATNGNEAETVAMSTAQAYVDARRESSRTRFAEQVAFWETQVDAIQVYVDQAGGLGSDEATSGGDRRGTLADRLLDAKAHLAAANVNLEQFNGEVADPVLDEPAKPSSALAWLLFAIVGAILGVLVALGAVSLVSSVDHRIRTRADIERIVADVPVIGVLPRSDADDASITAVVERARALARQPDAQVVPATRSEPVPSWLGDRLRGAGLHVADSLGGSDLPVVVAVRAGMVSDAQLAAIVADADARGLMPVGVLLVDVRQQELDWASRPRLAA